MTSPAIRCIRCRQQRCVCAHIEPVTSRVQIVIVRHAAERSRTSNTGHFAKLALTNCTLLEYGVRGARFDETGLATDAGTYLLYPGGAIERPPTPPARLIVLDGSWSQARHMRQRIRTLEKLPLFSLSSPGVPRARLRRPVHPGGLSTLEAIARALGLLEGEEQAAPLERLYDTLVQTRTATTGWPPPTTPMNL